MSDIVFNKKGHRFFDVPSCFSLVPCGGFCKGDYYFTFKLSLFYIASYPQHVPFSMFS